MSNKDITAVITSFKSENKIVNCIKSLGKDFQIIVIENSNDKKLKDKLEKIILTLNASYLMKIWVMLRGTI